MRESPAQCGSLPRNAGELAGLVVGGGPKRQASDQSEGNKIMIPSSSAR